MVRRSLLLAAALFLAAAPAFAKRSKVPALEAATVRAAPKADAAAVVEIKKGDQVLVLGKQGEWSQVMVDGGKKGWVLSKVVSAGGLDALDANAVTVAAAEGDTAMAARGRARAPVTVVVGMGGLEKSKVDAVADLLRKEGKLKVVDVRTEAGTKPGSPAGGLDGAAQLGGGKKADIVVAIQAGAGDLLQYEIVDLKNKAVLATGSTQPSTDPRKPPEEVAAAVSQSTAELVKNPASSATPAPAATPATPGNKDRAKGATNKDAAKHPNAPLKTDR